MGLDPKRERSEYLEGYYRSSRSALFPRCGLVSEVLQDMDMQSCSLFLPCLVFSASIPTPTPTDPPAIAKSFLSFTFLRNHRLTWVSEPSHYMTLALGVFLIISPALLVNITVGPKVLA